MPARYAIESLGSHHDRAAFSCGVEALDRYLRQQAGQDARRRIAAVFVVVDTASDREIAGFYTLSAASVRTAELPAPVTKRFPRYPQLPAVLLGRLAVDRRWSGQGVVALLLADALQRSYRHSEQIGAVFVVVDAKDEAARAFYHRFGFQAFVDEGRRLFLPMETIGTLV